jgi:hypothetical protein
VILDYLRLAVATGLVLLPGRLVARALGQRTLAATLAWTLAALFGAWAIVFAVHASIVLAVALLGAVAVVAGLAGLRRPLFRRPPLLRELVGLGGVLLGMALWHVEGAVVGDGLFHEARVRKLVDLGNLHLTTLDEFRDGGLHPGYAFPLWHELLAVVSWLSGLDPETVIRREPSLLVPLAVVLGWEAGVALFGSAWAGVSVAVVQVGLFCLAPGHGGSYATLALPGTAARQLLAPAAIALYFFWLQNRAPATLAAVAAIFGALTLAHPTYALFLLVPIVAAAVLRPFEWRRSALGLVAAIVPTGLAVLWLEPIADQTLSRNPTGTALANGLHQYASQLVVSDPHNYRLAAAVPGRSGALAVAALVLVPAIGLAGRRRWAAFALGGTVLVLALMEVPWLFVHLSDAVSLSQSRRAAGFAPLPFALAGAAALLARSVLVLPAGLVAGIVLQRLWPGDFGYVLGDGGPAAATWIALIGGAAALVLALVLHPRETIERHRRAVAAIGLLVLPVAVHGFSNWSPAHPTDPHALPPATIQALRTRVPARAVVIGPTRVSYEAVAAAPIYVVALPVSHVANTKANDPYRRRAAVNGWLAGKKPDVPERYGATWRIFRDGRLQPLPRAGNG